MTVITEEVGGVALGEEVAPPSVAPVEAECVDAVQPLHPGGQRFPGGLENEVIVRAQQAVRVCSPPDAARRRLE